MLAIVWTATLPPSATENSQLYGCEKEEKEGEPKSRIMERHFFSVKQL
jgi:hypothetical protein